MSLFAFACLGSRDVGEARERLCCLPEDTKLTRLLRGEILHGEDFFVPSGEGGYLDSFISAARAYRDFDASVIRSRGRVFLKREIVAKLAESGDFDFRETRLIEALRARTGRGSRSDLGGVGCRCWYWGGSPRMAIYVRKCHEPLSVRIQHGLRRT